MDLYQLLPYLTAIAGLLFGAGFAFWRLQHQIKSLRHQLKREQISNQQISDQHQSVSDQLHSVRNAHDRLNSSYNKLYSELDEKRNQLRNAHTANNRYLDRITNQQAAIQELQNQINGIEKQSVSFPKGGQPLSKAHFYKNSDQQKRQIKIDLPSSKDDLKKVKGINQDIEITLNLAGITTWIKLSRLDVEQLKHLLNEQGKNVTHLYGPATWPKQAELASKGRWRELKVWQRHWEEQKMLNNLVK